MIMDYVATLVSNTFLLSILLRYDSLNISGNYFVSFQVVLNDGVKHPLAYEREGIHGIID